MSGLKRIAQSIKVQDGEDIKANANAADTILKSIDTSSGAALTMRLMNSNPLMRKILGD